MLLEAGWQSGYAEDCKSLDAGSIPTPASMDFIDENFENSKPGWWNW